MAAGLLDAAVIAFRCSAALAPHFKTLELLGECLLVLGKPLEAIVPLAAATTLNRQPRAPSLLAKALLAAGDPEGAREIARMTLERAPTNRIALEVVAKTADCEEK